MLLQVAQALSCSLQAGIRFFRVPLPAVPWAFLAVGFPLQENYGLTSFRVDNMSGLGATYTPIASWLRDPMGNGVHLAICLLVQALTSVFGLSGFTMLQTVVYICSPYHSNLAPIRMTLTEISLPHDSLTVSLGYIVPMASHNSITRNACIGRLLMATH